MPNGRVVARLSRLAKPDGGRAHAVKAPPKRRGRQATAQPMARDRSRRRRVSIAVAISAGSRSRAAEGPGLADRALELRNDEGQHRRRRPCGAPARPQQTKLDVALDVTGGRGVSRAFGYTGRDQGRADQDQGPARLGGLARRLRLSIAAAAASRLDVGRGPVPQGRSRHREAARRAVAAGAAAADHARLPRRVQRGLRVRLDHRRRARSPG